MDAYEADVEGLKEAMDVMCRELVTWGGYARHQVERVPHFAPPLVLNQFTQAPHEPPPQGRCTSDQGEGEGRVCVIQAPQLDIAHVMNKEKKGGEHTNARQGDSPDAAYPEGEARLAVANGKQGKPRTNDLDIPISGCVTATAEAGDPPPAEPQPPGTMTEETDQPAGTTAPTELQPPSRRNTALAEK